MNRVTENSFTFKGVNALDATKKYEVTLNFLHPVDPERVTSKNIGRCLEFTIYKVHSLLLFLNHYWFHIPIIYGQNTERRRSLLVLSYQR